VPIRAPRSGLVRLKVLPLGISSAVALFQRQMEELLGENLLAAGLKVYLDDILIFTKTLQDHLEHLGKVLTKVSKAGLKIRKDKYTFAHNSAEFLGYKITPQVISICEDQIQALLGAPRPTKESEFRGKTGDTEKIGHKDRREDLGSQSDHQFLQLRSRGR